MYRTTHFAEQVHMNCIICTSWKMFSENNCIKQFKSKLKLDLRSAFTLHSNISFAENLNVFNISTLDIQRQH